MKYLSLCSGIEAATVAWQSLGWEAVAFAEIEPFPCEVLKHHYPNVPNLGDISQIDGRQFRGAVELIVAGTPCQDFSIAGKRAGMAGERSGLAREFIRLVREINPRWIVWENVPGVFSTNGGRDFGSFIKALDDSGYSCAWRVLDAQFFGVPQRRRRVFVVGYFGDWRPAAKILFESESLRRNFTPRRETRQNIASTVKDGSGKRGWENGANGRNTPMPAYVPSIVEQAISCKWAKGSSGPAGDEHHNLIAYAPKIAPAMGASGPPYERTGNSRVEADALVVNKNIKVRRLTPRECERLMGFPDDYTAIEYRGKPAPDSARYKALGNSMAVPVMRWIGERINRYKYRQFPEV